MPKIVRVSVGVIFNNQNQVLIAKRPLHKPLGGLWEFPGGKLEAQESPIAALNRELLEELQISLPNSQEHPKPFHEIKYVYLDNQKKYEVHLIIFKITAYLGQPIGAEGQEIKWVEPNDLMNYDFPDANQEIIKLLNH
jgi:8-oxo-dGTP diphosphatase